MGERTIAVRGACSASTLLISVCTLDVLCFKLVTEGFVCATILINPIRSKDGPDVSPRGESVGQKFSYAGVPIW